MSVADQDAALTFYTEVLGCELRADVEVWPGARLVEVVPPGSDVALVLLPPDSQIPVAIRLGASDAQQAYDRIRAAGATLQSEELVRIEGVSPMFSFTDPDGNGLVYLEDVDASRVGRGQPAAVNSVGYGSVLSRSSSSSGLP